MDVDQTEMPGLPAHLPWRRRGLLRRLPVWRSGAQEAEAPALPVRAAGCVDPARRGHRRRRRTSPGRNPALPRLRKGRVAPGGLPEARPARGGEPAAGDPRSKPAARPCPPARIENRLIGWFTPLSGRTVPACPRALQVLTPSTNFKRDDSIRQKNSLWVRFSTASQTPVWASILVDNRHRFSRLIIVILNLTVSARRFTFWWGFTMRISLHPGGELSN